MTDRREEAMKGHFPQNAEESDRLETDAPEKPVNQTPEAKRALAEAAERRRKRDEENVAREKEVGGQDGPDPVRYGDWEKGGIAWDF
ncbi:MAG: DUF1674 domain-containing protein [Pseudomonadota bacterium]